MISKILKNVTQYPYINFINILFVNKYFLFIIVFLYPNKKTIKLNSMMTFAFKLNLCLIRKLVEL